MLNIGKFNFKHIAPKIVQLSWATVLYGLCAYLSIHFAPSASYQSIFWPGSGVAVALLLLKGNLHFFSIVVGGACAYLIHGGGGFNEYASSNGLFSVWGLLLATSLVVVPAFQALIAASLVRRFCEGDLWVFAAWRRLLRLVIVAGVFPALFCVIFLLPSLYLYSSEAWPIFIDVGVSLFWGNLCGVAILMPCLLLAAINNPLVGFHRKLRIVIPVLGLFCVAALCYGALYHQLKERLAFEQETRLAESSQRMHARISNVYQQLQTLRFFLMEDRDRVDATFSLAAKRTFKAHLAVRDEPPFFSTALLSAQLNNRDEVDNYVISDAYPIEAFEYIKRMPLANDVNSLRVMQAASSRVQVFSLPNLDLARTSAGSFVVILLHQLFPGDPSRLLAAVIDVQNFAYAEGARYVGSHHVFKVEDVLSGRMLYSSRGVDTSDKAYNSIVFCRLLEVGDRTWRLTALYDAAWFEHQLQRELLYISIIALVLIAIFTLLILSALVSAESLERAVDARSKELEDERIFLDEIFENLPIFVFVKDVVTQKFIRVNRYVERMLGVPRSQYEGKTAYELFSEEEASYRSAADLKLVEHGGVLEVGEETIDSPLGRRWLYTRKSLICDAGGKARYILGMSEDITERRKQQQSLDDVIEAMPLSLLVVDDDGVIVYSNEMANKVASLSIGSTTLKEVLPDCDLGLVKQLLDAECSNSSDPLPIILSAKMQNSGGESLPIEATFSRAMWRGGVRDLVLIADISERINSQKSLRESENQLRLLMANLGEGVCGVDTAGNITYVNLAACNILGYSETSLLNENFYNSMLGANNLDGDPVFKACSLGQSTRAAGASFTRKDGSHLPVEYVCTPILADHNKNMGAVIVFNDLQERLDQKRRLDQRNELIALGLDASGLGSWEWQRSDNQMRWSANIYKILEMDEGSFSGELADVFEYIHPQDVAGVRLVDELAKQSLEVTDFCCRMFTGLGRVIWVAGKYRYFLGVDDRIFRARGVLWDSTDEALLQEDNREKTKALQRSNKELDDFAHIASHDLKEPLRGISNYSTFLLEDYADLLDADGKNMLNSIGRLTQHMERLISDLLSFSRLGRTELAFGEVDIDALVVTILESLLPRIEELNVYVSLESPLKVVYCDRVRVTELFRNLITNAMKYNDKPEKHITLGCNVKDEEFVFWVKDDGIGVAQDYQAQIFDVFKRLHGRREYGGGSGIGLSIVQKVVAQHGGRLWLDSEEGLGATFYVALPMKVHKS